MSQSDKLSQSNLSSFIDSRPPSGVRYTETEDSIIDHSVKGYTIDPRAVFNQVSSDKKTILVQKLNLHSIRVEAYDETSQDDSSHISD